MKAMLYADFVQMRRNVPQMLFICVFVCGIIIVSTQSPAASAAAVATMVPYILLYGIAANDEAAGWSKMRDTMPLTRRDIVAGRYAGTLITTAASCLAAFVLSMAVGLMIAAAYGKAPMAAFGALVQETLVASLLGCALALVMLAILLPVIMKMGLTRAARILPLVFVLVFCGAMAIMSDGFPSFQVLPPLGLVTASCLVVALALFAASMMVTRGLYESREF